MLGIAVMGFNHQLMNKTVPEKFSLVIKASIILISFLFIIYSFLISELLIENN